MNMKLMDHVIDTSADAYSGTDMADSFVIFHDGLSAWWEVGAQAHMTARGFKHRQIRNITANIGTRYEAKVVGDSPEICRGLDSHGFADMKAAILKYVSYSSLYEQDDPRRFILGTPEGVLSAIRRAWTVAPTSKRIVEDILDFEVVLDKIVEHEGCVVPDEDLRNGRRARQWERVNEKGICKNKPRKKQRKSTLISTVPIHPDIADAREMLLAIGKEFTH